MANKSIKKVVCFGATSKIAYETLKKFANDHVEFYLVGRNEEKLSEIKNDLEVRSGKVVKIGICDFSDLNKVQALVGKVKSEFSNFDTCLVCHGFLGEQEKAESDVRYANEIMNINFNSYFILLTEIANYFEEKQSGNICVISSVAGDRGRKSNYVYGTAKGAVSIFCQGLRNRLFDKGVNVLTIKPGFVSTPMTAHLKQGALFVSAETVAKGIYNAILSGKDEVYLPSFWRLIMMLIKGIPEFIFKKLSI